MGGEGESRVHAVSGADLDQNGIDARSTLGTTDDPDEVFDLVDLDDHVIERVRRAARRTATPR